VGVSCPEVELIELIELIERVGFVARNRGRAAGRGEIVVVFHNDVEAPPDLFELPVVVFEDAGVCFAAVGFGESLRPRLGASSAQRSVHGPRANGGARR